MSFTPMRGRVVVREIKQASFLEIVDNNPRATVTHRGEVIAMGPPFRMPSGAEIPMGFKEGDIVQFHFEGTEKGRTTTWNGHDGVVVMAQREIDAVVE